MLIGMPNHILVEMGGLSEDSSVPSTFTPTYYNIPLIYNIT